MADEEPKSWPSRKYLVSAIVALLVVQIGIILVQRNLTPVEQRVENWSKVDPTLHPDSSERVETGAKEIGRQLSAVADAVDAITALPAAHAPDGSGAPGEVPVPPSIRGLLEDHPWLLKVQWDTVTRAGRPKHRLETFASGGPDYPSAQSWELGLLQR
ncbi:MAG: hypothetical protein GY898_27370 [Proteobacteria bacterium]|nr:hypothetical protein [Pseudomonadota bacterium]